MNRARFTFAATLVGASCIAATALAQAQQPPPMTSVLAGKKFTPPFKGQAEIEFTKPVTKRDKDMVVTTVQVTVGSLEATCKVIFDSEDGKAVSLMTSPLATAPPALTA